MHYLLRFYILQTPYSESSEAHDIFDDATYTAQYITLIKPTIFLSTTHGTVYPFRFHYPNKGLRLFDVQVESTGGALTNPIYSRVDAHGYYVDVIGQSLLPSPADGLLRDSDFIRIFERQTNYSRTINSGNSTGTGARQTIPHGLCQIPNRVRLNYTQGGAAAFPYLDLASDIANIYPLASNGKDYTWEVEFV